LNVDERVFFLGHRDDVPSLINGCDMFILPSLFEGLPLTIIEAMAAGKPVIASDLIGIEEEVINSKTGLLVPKENSEALAEAIKYLISNPDYAQKLGNAGRIRAQQEFSADIMVKRISELDEKLIMNEKKGNIGSS